MTLEKEFDFIKVAHPNNADALTQLFQCFIYNFPSLSLACNDITVVGFALWTREWASRNDTHTNTLNACTREKRSLLSSSSLRPFLGWWEQQQRQPKQQLSSKSAVARTTPHHNRQHTHTTPISHHTPCRACIHKAQRKPFLVPLFSSGVWFVNAHIHLRT